MTNETVENRIAHDTLDPRTDPFHNHQRFMPYIVATISLTQKAVFLVFPSQKKVLIRLVRYLNHYLSGEEGIMMLIGAVDVLVRVILSLKLCREYDTPVGSRNLCKGFQFSYTLLKFHLKCYDKLRF